MQTPNSTSNDWKRDLLRECVEPNPGPSWEEILKDLVDKKLGGPEKAQQYSVQLNDLGNLVAEVCGLPNDKKIREKFLGSQKCVEFANRGDDEETIIGFLGEIVALPAPPPGNHGNTEDIADLRKSINDIWKALKTFEIRDYDSISRVNSERATSILNEYKLIFSANIKPTLYQSEQEYKWDDRTEVLHYSNCLIFIKQVILGMKKNKKRKDGKVTFKDDNGVWVVTTKHDTEYDTLHSIKGVIGDIRENTTPVGKAFEIKKPEKICKPDSERQAALTLVLALCSNKLDNQLSNNNLSAPNNPIIILTDLATSCWQFSYNEQEKAIIKTEINTWNQLAQIFAAHSTTIGGTVGGEGGSSSRGDKVNRDDGGDEGGEGGEERSKGSKKNTNQISTDSLKTQKQSLFVREIDLEALIEQTLSLPVEERKEFIYSACLSCM